MEEAFQLTRSRGAWRNFDALTENIIIFQLTRSRGAWHIHTLLQHLYKKFQLTRSRGAWQHDEKWRKGWDYFNSHAHVERDQRYFVNQWIYGLISTHTLTWSVTYPFRAYFTGDTISTHTLTWSVTKYGCEWTGCKRFQLTRSRGAWQSRRLNCRRK